MSETRQITDVWDQNEKRKILKKCCETETLILNALCELYNEFSSALQGECRRLIHSFDLADWRVVSRDFYRGVREVCGSDEEVRAEIL